MDAGGVLYNNPIEDSVFLDEVAAHAGVSRASLARCYDERDGEFETGALSVHGVLQGILRELRAPAELTANVAWIDRLYLGNVVAHLEAFQLVRELRAAGHVVALCNNEAQHWDELKDREFGHFGLFDHLLSSWVVGHVKPGRAYFDAVRARCGAEGVACLLVDDNPEVLAAARQLGVQALAYSNVHQARAELERLGVAV